MLNQQHGSVLLEGTRMHLKNSWQLIHGRKATGHSDRYHGWVTLPEAHLQLDG